MEDLSGRGVRSLAAGQYHSAATLHEGGVYTWGKNDYGQLGACSAEPRLRPGRLAPPLDEVDLVATDVACGCVEERGKGRDGRVGGWGLRGGCWYMYMVERDQAMV